MKILYYWISISLKTLVFVCTSIQLQNIFMRMYSISHNYTSLYNGHKSYLGNVPSQILTLPGVMRCLHSRISHCTTICICCFALAIIGWNAKILYLIVDDCVGLVHCGLSTLWALIVFFGWTKYVVMHSLWIVSVAIIQ